MEDNLHFLLKDDINIIVNVRQHNLFSNGRQPQCSCQWKRTYKRKVMQPKTFKIKTMDVAPLWITKYEDIYGFIKVAIGYYKSKLMLYYFILLFT